MKRGLDEWMGQSVCVYTQFGVATSDEPIICQRASEYERKGNMVESGGFAGSALLVSSSSTKHDEKCCSVCECVCVCVYVYQ